MKAIGFHQHMPINQAESLVDLTIARPVATGRDILVKVQAISVNPVDTKVRGNGSATYPEGRVIGWDAAGTVEAVGEEVTLFQPGDEVYYAGALDRSGTNAEYHLVDERIVGRKPSSLNFAQAAALPLTAITAWEVLFDRLCISRDPAQNQGKRLLIIGAAGGVGSIAVQLARLAGLTVIGTASREESAAWVRKLGAQHTLDHSQPFVPQLQALGYDDVHSILCLSSAEAHWQEMGKAIRPQGSIGAIVEMSASVDLNGLMGKSVNFAWEMMGTRSLFQTEDMIAQHQLLNEVAHLVDTGELLSPLTQELSPINAQNLRRAHAQIETGKTIGKVVLSSWS